MTEIEHEVTVLTATSGEQRQTETWRVPVRFDTTLEAWEGIFADFRLAGVPGNAHVTKVYGQGGQTMHFEAWVVTTDGQRTDVEA